MATRKPPRKMPRTQGVPPSVASGSDRDETSEASANLFDALSDDSYVTLHKYDEVSKGLVYVGKLFPSEANEEFLQDTYGGGRWRCQERTRNDVGQFVIGRTRTLVLAGAPKRVEDMPIRKNNPTASATVGTLNAAGEVPRGNSREMLDAAMTSQVMDLLKMSKEVRPSGDDKVLPLVMQQVTAMQGMLMKVMEVMSTPRDVGDPMANMVAMMGVMAELFKSREKAEAPTDISKLIEGMRSLKDLSDDVNRPEGNTGDPLMDSIPKVVGLFEQVMANQRQGPRVNPPQGARTVATPNQPQVAAPLWQQLILQSKGLLLSIAGRGVNPEDAAQSMTVMMPEHHVGILKEFLAMPDAVSSLMNTVPEMQNFPDWTGRFVQALREIMADEPEEETPDVDAEVAPE